MEARKYLKRLLPAYINHRNYINKGLSEANTLRYVVQIVLIGKIAYRQMPTSLMIMSGFITIIAFWAIGWAWDKVKGYDAETEWGNKRNPTIQHIKKRKL